MSLTRLLLRTSFVLVSLVLAGCTKGGSSENTSTITPLASATLAAPAMSTSIAQPLLRTEVVRYEPPPAAQESTTGSCFGHALSVRRSDAWRCNSDIGGIQDPCFGTADARSVTCPHPFRQAAPTIRINLADRACTNAGPTRDAFCDPQTQPPDTPVQPWFFLTVDGATCLIKGGGTSLVINGLRLNYFCDQGEIAFIGIPTPGDDGIWVARGIAQPSSSQLTAPEILVQLRTIWW